MHPLILLTVLSLAAAPAQAAHVHSWTDAQGARHYSDRPPPGLDSRPQALRPAPSPGPSQARPVSRAQRAAAEQRRFDEVLRQDAAREEQARRQRCRQLAERIDLLENRARLSGMTGGERYPLSDAERGRLLEETRARWRISCPR